MAPFRPQLTVWPPEDRLLVMAPDRLRHAPCCDFRHLSPLTLHMLTHPHISDSQWLAMIRGLQAGEPAVLHRFYVEFGPMLRAIADKRVSPLMQRRFDADDVVQSTFRTFFRRAQGGEFQFEDNQRLWSLLCAITLTKLREKARYHRRQARSAAREQPIADSWGNDDPERGLPSPGPPPESALEFAEEFEHLLAGLDDPERRLIDLKLQDRTNDEAAEALGVSERTVRRMLSAVQAKFTRLLAPHML